MSKLVTWTKSDVALLVSPQEAAATRTRAARKRLIEFFIIISLTLIYLIYKKHSTVPTMAAGPESQTSVAENPEPSPEGMKSTDRPAMAARTA